jgi:hypothetical protein
MPAVLGSQFQTDQWLRDRVYLVGDHIGPYLAAQEGYRSAANAALNRGQTAEALDAYRRSLHYSLAFTHGLSQLSGLVMTEAGLENLDLDRQFGGTERRLTAAVWAGSVAFNPDTYSEFVAEVREETTRNFRLYHLFHFGHDRDQNWESVQKPNDPATAREYIDHCVELHRFDAAAFAARIMGWTDEEAALKARTAEFPDNRARIQADIEAWEDARDIW